MIDKTEVKIQLDNIFIERLMEVTKNEDEITIHNYIVKALIDSLYPSVEKKGFLRNLWKKIF